MNSVEAVAVDDLQAALWHKFVFIAPLIGAASLSRATVYEALAQPATRALIQQALANSGSDFI